MSTLTSITTELVPLLVAAVVFLAGAVGALFGHYVREQRRWIRAWEEQHKMNLASQTKWTEALGELRTALAVLSERLPR